MIEMKWVVQGGFGPVPMEENSRRYIDAEPVSIPMTSYYVRRMMSGELVEKTPPAPLANAPQTAVTSEDK
jgi:hypothetical protein